MKNWKSETGKYLKRLEALSQLISQKPKHPENIPHPPLDIPTTELQGLLHRTVITYELGVWGRSNETVSAVLCLWAEGFLCEAASLSRLLFEIWGLSAYQTKSLEKYKTKGNLASLAKATNRIFEGVRSQVLMPWGTPASEKPIHVMDTIRSLKEEYPLALETYDDLCESAHANQPRYFEWWVIGKYGDNWTNKTVQLRGHALLEKTVSSIESCVNGIRSSLDKGLTLCGQLY
ncbi:MAG: hypothetical protein WBD64_07225 [Candidatus Zixiibacteriota bacterium]